MLHRSFDRPSVDRSYLCFAEAVHKYFDSLLKDHSFQRVSFDQTFVRYESDEIFINVYHGRSSYEIAMEMGRLNHPDEHETSYTIGSFMRLIDPKQAENYRSFAATNPNSVEKGVSQLSELFKKYALSPLLSDKAIFTKLRKQREVLKDAFVRKVLVSQVRPEATEAFQRKDYQEAARLYESIKEDLTPTEVKKLQYAKKHMTTK
jgi:hypothetical protein